MPVTAVLPDGFPIHVFGVEVVTRTRISLEVGPEHADPCHQKTEIQPIDTLRKSMVDTATNRTPLFEPLRL